ncbi:MAG TPA: bifunctional [glutamate--ammonia ligase]-adenylyl-L-tyrosine phosphorylase/[glutamate--ammonia-ligase] adenylyltransferase [Quisquiliibacterium sp.]|nr:bifunctional [glutamate--ammonia ligase]-adenylyl-L-tyrosine phosphorylase/[glutamate--ammonia-ligase] adenylyltransferase [Quisquiliibacterium sp.]
MTYRAEAFSGFFRRSLAALQARRGEFPDPIALLDALVAAPIDAVAIEAATSAALQAGREEAARRQDPSAVGPAVARALRRVRQCLMMALAERDIAGLASLDEVCRAMTAFGAIATREAMRQASAELAAQFGRPLDAAGQPQDLLAVAMGKGGADELNVSSDLDLVFVFREPGETEGAAGGEAAASARGRLAAGEFMHRLARRTIQLLADPTADGFVFRVDTRLRPNGDSGPLVASLPMLEDYFFSQGREWERFAWLKGRVIADSGMAGDEARRRDEQSLASLVTPFVFRRYLDFRAFDALRELHDLIRAEVMRRNARGAGSIDVKLGRGGIREIEFAAQLFQVVRGGRDPGLRDRRTLATLSSLAERGILPADDARALADAYVLLRRTEHALQFREDAQTHRLPADPDERAVVARMLGLAPEEFASRLDRSRADVQRVFDGLLRAPEQEAGGDASASAPAPVSENVQRRIDALREAPRYRSAREETRAAIETLLARAPALAGEEHALLRLLDLIEAVLGRPAYISLLAQYRQALSRVVKLLGRAKWAADYLTRHPILLDELLDGQLLEPVDYAAWERSVRAALEGATLNGQPDVERRMDIVREAHHAQVFRLLVQDLEGLHTVERISDHLSDLADRVLEIAIDQCWPQVRSRHRERPRFAVIAYGRLGGKELGYASDLDLVFVHEDEDERAPEAYATLSQRMATWLSARTAAGQLFEIDLRLRPNGNAGLLVSSLKAFQTYQRESAWVWEHQALSRARFAAGDREIGAAFEAERRAILARPRDRAALRGEVVAMRRKMHEGHPNRSALFDLKHDEGGMVDIEFVVQYLVLAHSIDHPGLLDNVGNIALLRRAGAAGLIDAGLAERTASAYREFRQLQHTVRLNDAQYARVPQDTVAAMRADVRALWNAVLGDRAAGA